jgi:hypothetical protein
VISATAPTAKRTKSSWSSTTSTSTGSRRYEAFAPAEARRLAEKIEVHFTPKHGSWLNMAEIELSVLARQCLDQRIASIADLRTLLDQWRTEHNAQSRTIKWRFTTDEARIKLRRLYPSTEG